MAAKDQPLKMISLELKFAAFFLFERICAHSPGDKQQECERGQGDAVRSGRGVWSQGAFQHAGCSVPRGSGGATAAPSAAGTTAHWGRFELGPFFVGTFAIWLNIW